jgi:hypothetical protein
MVERLTDITKSCACLDLPTFSPNTPHPLHLAAERITCSGGWTRIQESVPSYCKAVSWLKGCGPKRAMLRGNFAQEGARLAQHNTHSDGQHASPTRSL